MRRIGQWLHQQWSRYTNIAVARRHGFWMSCIGLVLMILSWIGLEATGNFYWWLALIGISAIFVGLYQMLTLHKIFKRSESEE